MHYTSFLLQVKWDVSPVIFHIGGFSLRYYSLLFGLAFLSSYTILSRVFTREKVPLEDLNSLTIYVFLGTLIGARLGQVFFYEFGYYSTHLLEIILPFRIDKVKGFEFTGFQGLASHGGAVGILTAIYFYCRRHQHRFLWVADRVALVVPLAGFFIRLGNLFNSEIIGKPFNGAWAFIFYRIDTIPRHPTQLYEAVCYLLIFGLLWMVFKRKGKTSSEGLLFGLFLVLVFTVRFALEFLKENQEAFENRLPLNMGQILSLPLVLTGLILICRSCISKSPNKVQSNL